MSSSSDKVYIPFNFSSVLPFDAIANTLNQLSSLQLEEPDGSFSYTCAATSSPPSPGEQRELRNAMMGVVQDEEWRRNIAQHVLPLNSPLPAETPNPPWLDSFSNQLASNIQQSTKRSTQMHSPLKRPTPKRPRPQSAYPSSSSTPRSFHTESTQRRNEPTTPSRSRNSTTTQLSHAQELRMHEGAKIVDQEEFTHFVESLRAFVRRPDDLARTNPDLDVDPALLVTANSSVIQDLRQSIRLVSSSGAIGQSPSELLSLVIAILRARMRECAHECTFAHSDSNNTPSSSDAALGLLAASTILTIICAPLAPRNLLVEELLEDIVDVFRSVSTLVIFPMCDPLYKAAKSRGQKKKKCTQKRRAPVHGSVKRSVAGDNADSDYQDTLDNDGTDNEGRGTGSRRPLLRKDEILLTHSHSFLEDIILLFQKEAYLPESVVSQCASICSQSLSVTGIVRFQSHSIKLLSTVFFCYPALRVSILDDVREVVTVIPANRRHLRTYQLPEDKSSVRAPSALLCSLLSIASNDAEVGISGKKNAKVSGEKMEAWCSSRLKRQERSVKLAAHTLDPLFNRACGDREAEFKVAFQSFLEDLLTLYGRPEWPAAELMLQTLSVAIIKKLRGGEEKSVYARGVAIDTLGALASRMCDLYGSEIVKEKDRSAPSDVGSDRLEQERERALLFLRQNQSVQMASAHAFLEALLLSDDYNIASSMSKKSLNLAGQNGNGDESEENIDGSDDVLESKEAMLKRVVGNALERLQRVESRQSRGEDVTRLEALRAWHFIGVSRSFAGGFKTIMEAMFDGMHDPAPTIRAKSIKALSSIDESCHGLLHVFPGVLPYIEASCRDVSTLARDAALDLLSRNLLPDSTHSGELNGDGHSNDMVSHITQDSNLFNSIFDVVIKRMCDTATSVRKRAITITKAVLSDAVKSCNLLRNTPVKGADIINEKNMFEDRIIRICTSLVSRLDDPEMSVREAAERVLRFGLFGFDISNSMTWKTGEDDGNAHQLAQRLTSVYVRLSPAIHMSFMSRVVHKAMLIKEKPLLMSIVSAAVEQLHKFEGEISQEFVGCNVKSLPMERQIHLKTLSSRRVGCSSVICAFGSLDTSLIEPHCRSLAPSIKGVVDGCVSESDLVSVQRVLNTLEVGLGRCKTLDAALIEEVLNDVEVIVCQSPTSILEEASVRCLSVVASKSKSPGGADVVLRSAVAFKEYLDRQLHQLENLYEKDRKVMIAVERNTRCAVMRLGLLARYGSFTEEFTADVYKTLRSVCMGVTRTDERGILAKAAVRALGHFLIRERSFLPDGTKLFVSLMEKANGGNTARVDGKGDADAVMAGVKLCILQSFHELLRDEEERNAVVKERGIMKNDEPTGGNGEGDTQIPTRENVESSKQNEVRQQPVLAAEEDAEAGFLALSAQAMLPCVKESASHSSTTIRRTVANIVGLLVRQGLLLPATVVPCLFTLLLDRDTVCREFAMRVVAFLADRHSGMLTSAAVPAMRACFTNAYSVQWGGIQECSAAEGQVTFEKIRSIAIDDRTGHCFLSGALMSMRREQRRGVLESLIREFDPRVVAVQSVNGEEAPVADDVKKDGKSEVEEEDNDDVCTLGTANMDLSECDGGGPERCSLETLCFIAMTLACVDYTNGAGIGGSLSQGGGTAAAEGKMKIAREDVNELVGIATRIISNSGQAILRVSNHVSKKYAGGVCNPEMSEKTKRMADWAGRMCILLCLKNHLKVERWKNACLGSGAGDDGKREEDLYNCRMVAFQPDIGLVRLATREMTESEAHRQLQILFKLMRDDAIDEGDVNVVTRRSKGGGGRGRSSRGGRARQVVLLDGDNNIGRVSRRMAGSTSQQATPASSSMQSSRQKPRRRPSGARKRKRFLDDDSDDDSDSDFDGECLR